MTPQDLRKLIDSDPAFFAPDGSDDMQADGYVSTTHLMNLLTGSYGTIPNPVPAPQIASPLSIGSLMGAAPHALSTLSETLLIEIGNRVREQDRTGVGMWARIIHSRGQMNDVEFGAVMAVLSVTILDPNWPKEIAAPPKCADATAELINEALGRKV